MTRLASELAYRAPAGGGIAVVLALLAMTLAWGCLSSRSEVVSGYSCGEPVRGKTA